MHGEKGLAALSSMDRSKQRRRCEWNKTLDIINKQTYIIYDGFYLSWVGFWTFKWAITTSMKKKNRKVGVVNMMTNYFTRKMKRKD